MNGCTTTRVWNVNDKLVIADTIENAICEELEINELDIADHSSVIKNYKSLIKDITDYILTLAEEGE